MNEEHFAFKVRQHLNRGLHDLRPETGARLAAARGNAMARQKQTVSQSVLATAGNFVQYHLENIRVKQALAAIVLLLGVITTTYWVADQRVTELGALDSALLADDLPIGAFTDKGFAAWLKSSSSE